MSEETYDPKLKGNLNKDNNPFRDSRNNLRTQSLFYEYNQTDNPSLFTLKKEYDYELNGVTYISLKKRYMEMEDVLEINFARKYLESWEHWQKLLNNAILLAEIEKWRAELEVQIRSKGIQALLDTALEEGSKGTTAAKFLVDRGWVEKTKKKEDTTKRAVKEKTSSDVADFLQRIK